LPVSYSRTKRIFFLAISLVHYSIQCVRKWTNLLLGDQPTGTCAVLYYHDIGPCQDRFAQQMQYLARWAIPLPANFKAPLKNGKRYTCITFCDGFICFLEKALPELVKHNIPATIFVPSGYLGTCPGWADDNDHPGLVDQIIMDAEQLKSLPTDLVIVGSHGVFHKNLSSLCRCEAGEELFRSKQDLERIIQREVKLFFFPYGGYNKTSLELAREAGYDRVFCTVPRPAFRNPNEFLSGAIIVDPGDWLLEFKLKVLGGYNWLSLIASAKQSLTRLKRNQPRSGSS